jgi:aminotransferase
MVASLHERHPFALSTSEDTIDLAGESLGFTTAPHIRAAAQRALDDGETHYTTRPGLDPLREAVSQRLAVESGIQADPKTEIIITSGTQEALFVALNVLIEPGDTVLVIRPSRPAYVDIARHAKARVSSIRGSAGRGFAVDPDRVARAITADTRVLVLGSPLVPAGVVHGESVLQALAALAVEHNLAVICDETFSPFVFDGTPHRSIGSLPGMAERTLTIGGFSLSYALAGWRVGYLAGPQPIMAAMMKLKQALSICSAAVSQFAALAAVTGPQYPLEDARAALTARRLAALSSLDAAGISYAPGAAGPYLLLDGSHVERSDRALAQRIEREAGVRLAPGSLYGLPSWLRLTLAEPEERLTEAVERMQPILARGGNHGG